MTHTIPYELALELKKAGFPQTKHTIEQCKAFGCIASDCVGRGENTHLPTLSELIEATPQLFKMIKRKDGWTASAISRKGAPVPSKNLVMKGPTLEVAVGRLFLALNPK